jgi:hypothetical protein
LNINWSEKSDITFNKTNEFLAEIKKWTEQNPNNKNIFDLIEDVFSIHNIFFNSHYFRKEPFHKIEYFHCKNILKTE